MPKTFIELQAELYPRWCKAPRWAAFISAWTSRMDDVVARVRGTLAARLPSKAPADALDAIGADDLIPRVHGESNAAYRAYLASPHKRNLGRGLPSGILEQVQRLGFSTGRVVTYQDLKDDGVPAPFGGEVSGGVDANGDPILIANWHYFFLDLQGGGYDAPSRWDLGVTWDGGETWDLRLPYPQALDELRRTVREWKPAHTSCRFARIHLPDGTAVNVPIGEEWEFDADGNFTDYYLTGW